MKYIYIYFAFIYICIFIALYIRKVIPKRFKVAFLFGVYEGVQLNKKSLDPHH